jgi:hypothetical protein
MSNNPSFGFPAIMKMSMNRVDEDTQKWIAAGWQYFPVCGLIQKD